MDNFKDNDPNAPELIEAPKDWDKVDTSIEPDYKAAERELTEKLAANGITVTMAFVPRSKSADPKKEVVNWTYSLKKGDREILSGPFTQGVGHIHGWKNKWNGRKTMYDEKILTTVLEHGGATTLVGVDKVMPGKHNGSKMLKPRIRVVEPSPATVMSCLCLDGSAIDSPTYEDWASEMGYEKDSRSGEKIYRECLATGLKLRAALGDVLFSELRELSARL